MFVKRVIGALTFKRAAYADVKKDNSFTITAWGIVVVLILITQLIFNYDSFANKPIQILIGGAGYLAGFAFLAFGPSWLGKTLFKADVSFAEMVRTLGLASIWVFVFFCSRVIDDLHTVHIGTTIWCSPVWSWLSVLPHLHCSVWILFYRCSSGAWSGWRQDTNHHIA